jgi:glutamate N-acetyltransferase/amino-acid N-acetyltransferase
MAHSTTKISPFAPKQLIDMPAIDGVRFAACAAGIRYRNRTDLLVAVLDPGTAAAGVLTQSKTCSAPVLWCRQSLKGGKARILVVNSGNANAFTGKRGREAVETTAEFAMKRQGANRARSISHRPESSANRWMPESSGICSTASSTRPRRTPGSKPPARS